MAQQAALSANTQPFGFARQLADCNSSYDILRLTREFATEYGFQHFTIGRLPGSNERKLASVTMITNCPPELIARYAAACFLEKGPVARAMRRSIRPIVFSDIRANREEFEAAGPDYRALWEIYGIREGITIPVQHVSGARGFVAVFGSREHLAPNEVMELSYYGNLIYERLVDIIAFEKEPAMQPLSQRELECLHWIASGKTSQETAIILGLSEHTVNHYLNSACQKLGAANRPHAVAKAIRSRLLD